MGRNSQAVSFPGAAGNALAARLDLPSDSAPKAFALFAEIERLSDSDRQRERFHRNLRAMFIYDANLRDAPAFKRCFFEARCMADPRSPEAQQQARERDPNSRPYL